MINLDNDSGSSEPGSQSESSEPGSQSESSESGSQSESDKPDSENDNEKPGTESNSDKTKNDGSDKRKYVNSPRSQSDYERFYGECVSDKTAREKLLGTNCSDPKHKVKLGDCSRACSTIRGNKGEKECKYFEYDSSECVCWQITDLSKLKSLDNNAMASAKACYKIKESKNPVHDFVKNRPGVRYILYEIGFLFTMIAFYYSVRTTNNLVSFIRNADSDYQGKHIKWMNFQKAQSEAITDIHDRKSQEHIVNNLAEDFERDIQESKDFDKQDHYYYKVNSFNRECAKKLKNSDHPPQKIFFRLV